MKKTSTPMSPYRRMGTPTVKWNNATHAAATPRSPVSAGMLHRARAKFISFAQVSLTPAGQFANLVFVPKILAGAVIITVVFLVRRPPREVAQPTKSPVLAHEAF